MLTEGIVLSAVFYLGAQLLIFEAVPCVFYGHFMQVAEIRYFKIVAAADSQFAVWHDPHIGKGHKAGFFDQFFCRLFVWGRSCAVCKHLF